MKLALAVDEFIRYKQALGNLYTGSANILRAFLRRTGNLELDALTTQHAEAFLQLMVGRLRATGFIVTRCSVASSVLQPAAAICSSECSPRRCLIGRPASCPTFIRLKMSADCWRFQIPTTRWTAPCRRTPCARCSSCCTEQDCDWARPLA